LPAQFVHDVCPPAETEPLEHDTALWYRPLVSGQYLAAGHVVQLVAVVTVSVYVPAAHATHAWSLV